MGRFVFYTSLLLLLLNMACQEPAVRPKKVENDTTMVFKILFDSTILLPRLADQDRLFLNNPFHDSVIVVKDEVLNKFLPQYQFKFLTKTEISELSLRYSDSLSGPNYLEFDIQRENDTVYRAVVTNYENRGKGHVSQIQPSCEKLMRFTRTNKGFSVEFLKGYYD